MPYAAPSLSRRAVMRAGGAFFAWSHLPKIAHAATARDPRLVVIVLRGALDGLAAVAPIGDPHYADLHGPLALSLDGEHRAIALDGFFALNPALPTFADLYRKGEAAVVHAAATGYRERSHFDGQDVLESGLPAPGDATSGWLNRAIQALPQGERVRGSGLAVGPSTPLIMRGAAPVIGWAPQTLPLAGDDLAMRVLDLYEHRDAALAAALKEGIQTAHYAGATAGPRLSSAPGMVGTRMPKPPTGAGPSAAMRQAARGAAQIMAADDGPRIATLAFDGWDTHANEGATGGRLANLLGGLDGALGEIKAALADKWRQTAIAIVTEFGRTARINGTVGTDHGTGTVILLAGGAVRGGRVIADWPGLAAAQLYEGRDLRPTTDVRGVLKGLLAGLFDVSATALATAVFPESRLIAPLQGIVA